jgi:hypothetical protein
MNPNASGTASIVFSLSLSALREEGPVRLPMFRAARGLIDRPHARLIRILNVFHFLTTLKAKALGAFILSRRESQGYWL